MRRWDFVPPPFFNPSHRINMQLLLLFAVITACVWALVLIPRWTPLMMAVSYLIVASAYGYSMFNFDVGISMSFDRLLLIALVGSFAWQWWRRRTATRDVPASELLLFGFMVVLILNMFAYDWRRGGEDQVPILQHMIEGYLIPLILYWIARRSMFSEKTVDRVYLLFGCFGVYLAFTALCEVAGLWGFVFPRKIGDPELGIHFGRARGPFLQSVRLGIYLLVCLFATWIPLVWRNKCGRGGQLAAFILFGVYSAAIFATYTRSVWLAFAISAFLVAILTFPILLKRATIIAAVAAAVLVVASRGNLVSLQREFGAQETKESTEMRAVFAYVSWLMFKDRPIAGHGFGHYPHKNRPYLNDRTTKLQMETVRGYIHHNTWLSILVELGLVGFSLYVALFLAWSNRAWRLFKDVAAPKWMRGQALLFVLLIVSYAIQMVFHDVSYSPMENGILFLMAGLTSGICSMRLPASTWSPSFSWRSPRITVPSVN